MSDIDDERKGRPSASGALENTLCKGRHKMCLPLPDESSPYSVDGTAQHFRMQDPSFKIRKDLIPATVIAAEQRDNVVGLVWNDWRKNKPEVFLEHRLWYRQNKFSGQADYVAVRDGKALIIDYKFGRGKVDAASKNHQLMWLAVLIDHHCDVDQVTVAIVQPSAGVPTLHTYSNAEIKLMRKRVLYTIRQIDSNNLHLRSGEKQCKYCKAVSICPAVDGKREALSKIDQSSLTELTDGHLASILPSLEAVKALCSKIEEEAVRRLRSNPRRIKGWEVGLRSGKREILRPAEAYDKLLGSGVIDEEGLSKSMSLQLRPLQKVIQEYNEVSAKEASSMLADALGENLKKHEPKEKLCRTA